MALRYLRIDARFEDSLLVWTRGFLMRYAPSGALQWVYRVKERDRLQATTTADTGGHRLRAAGGADGRRASICLASFAAAGLRPPLIGLLLSVAAIGVAIAVRPDFLGRLLARQLVKRGYQDVALLRGRYVFVLICCNVAGWIATSIGVYLLVAGLSDKPVDPFFLTGAYRVRLDGRLPDAGPARRHRLARGRPDRPAVPKVRPGPGDHPRNRPPPGRHRRGVHSDRRSRSFTSNSRSAGEPHSQRPASSSHLEADPEGPRRTRRLPTGGDPSGGG